MHGRYHRLPGVSDKLHDIPALYGIKGGHRFIGHQDTAAAVERTANPCALLLSPRELPGFDKKLVLKAKLLRDGGYLIDMR